MSSALRRSLALADAVSSQPQLAVETKLMQQYRIGAAAHGGGEAIAVRGRAGVELFTTGTDGTVWNYYPDPTSDTGFSSVSTGLGGGAIGADVDAAGNIVLLGGNGMVLNYVIQTGQASGPRWGAVSTATLNLHGSGTVIAAVIAAKIDGALYVGVLTQIQNAFPGKTYALSWTNWAANPGVFAATNATLSSINGLWTGAAGTAALTFFDGGYYDYQVATGTLIRHQLSGAPTILAVADATPSGGQPTFYSVQSDGNLYTLIGGGAKPWSWAQVTQGASLLDLRVQLDDAGTAQILALGTGGDLFHIAPDGPGWTTPAPIATSAALIATAPGVGGDLELFMVGTTQATVNRVVRNDQSGDWEISRLEVPTNGQIEEFVAYSSDATVLDASGAVLGGTPVQVWASAQTQISVNGATYTIDSSTPANLTTDGAGRVTVTQAASRLGVPSLQFGIASITAANGVAVRQFAGTQDRLKSVTPSELLSAKVASGVPLLPDAYRNQATADALSSAFQECMAVASSTVVTLEERAFGVHAARRGVGPAPHGSACDLNRLRSHAGLRHWRIDFAEATPRFEHLTLEHAHALIASKQATHQTVGGIFDIFEDIGDFIVGVADGIVEVVDAVVTTIGDAITATITFIADGVSYVFNQVIEFVEQAFDLVETIFAKVKVFFGQLFEWLGFLFDWPDILRTHKALVYTANQYLTFLQGAAAGMQTIVDANFATLLGNVEAVFDTLIAAVGADTPGGYMQQNDNNPAAKSGMANNVVYNGVVDNIGGATSTLSLTARERLTGVVDPLVQQFEQYANSIANLPEWQQALSYLQNLGGSLDNVFKQLLSALLTMAKGVCKALVSGLQAIVDALLQAIGAIIAELQSTLNAAWNIPFISALYAWIADGAELTLLDLLALITAIPTTVLFKASQNAAPFPDDASEAAFEASFTGQSLLAASGLDGGANASLPTRREQLSLGSPGPITGAGATLLAIGSSVAIFFGGCFSAIMDFKPTLDGKVDPLAEALAWPTFGFEAFSQACSIPWLTDTAAPSCSSAAGAVAWLWICESVGTTFDAYWIWKDATLPENGANDSSVVAAGLYGMLHTLVLGLTWSELNDATRVAKVAMVVPEVLKLLRLKPVISMTEGISLPVLSGIDFLGGTTAAIAGLIGSISSDANPQSPQPRLRIPGAVQAA